MIGKSRTLAYSRLATARVWGSEGKSLFSLRIVTEPPQQMRSMMGTAGTCLILQQQYQHHADERNQFGRNLRRIRTKNWPRPARW